MNFWEVSPQETEALLIGSGEYHYPEKVEDAIASVEAYTRQKFEKYGMPGFVAWNLFDGFKWGIPTYLLTEGTTVDKLSYASIAFGISVGTNVSFWWILYSVGKKVASVFDDDAVKREEG